MSWPKGAWSQCSLATPRSCWPRCRASTTPSAMCAATRRRGDICDTLRREGIRNSRSHLSMLIGLNLDLMHQALNHLALGVLIITCFDIIQTSLEPFQQPLGIHQVRFNCVGKRPLGIECCTLLA